MKNIVLLIALSLALSCGKDKVVLLPEISHSDISEIKDVSAAYIFYDETKPDSTELNRRNLISTTNWLVNVDKRLTLKQVIPHIKFLQEKKGSSSHKNEKAKNYFTCNDTSRKNLGFIEFTDVVYQYMRIVNLLAEENSTPSNNLVLRFTSLEDIKISSFFDKANLTVLDISELNNYIKTLSVKTSNKMKLILHFNKEASFQNYITVKSLLLKLGLKNVSISKLEFISN